MKIRKYFVNRMLKRWEKNDREVFAAQQLPCGIVAQTDIPYLDDGHAGHLLDVYYPEAAKKNLPVIINIHGGGFLYGDKALNKLFGYHLAKRGYVVYNLNYRIAPDDSKVPEQIWDVVCAIRWIQDHIRDYPADETRLFLVGDSAGGVLAVMAALIVKSPRLRELFHAPEAGVDIRALSIFSGMMRFDAPSIRYWGMRSMCFAKGYQRQDTYRNMIFDKLPETALLPPVFLSTSQEDELKSMTLDFERTLQKHGVPYRLRYFKKGQKKKLGHIFAVQHPDYEESVALIDEMLAFFHRCGHSDT